MTNEDRTALFTRLAETDKDGAKNILQAVEAIQRSLDHAAEVVRQKNTECTEAGDRQQSELLWDIGENLQAETTAVNALIGSFTEILFPEIPVPEGFVTFAELQNKNVTFSKPHTLWIDGEALPLMKYQWADLLATVLCGYLVKRDPARMEDIANNPEKYGFSTRRVFRHSADRPNGIFYNSVPNSDIYILTATRSKIQIRHIRLLLEAYNIPLDRCAILLK